MIVLLDGVGDPLQSRRRMIELARDVDAELRMTEDGVIIDRDAAIGRDELAASVRTSGLISSDRASTVRAAANNWRIDSFR